MKTEMQEQWRKEFEIVWESIDDSQLRQVGFPYFLAAKQSSLETIEKLQKELEKANDKVHELEDRLEQSCDIGVVTRLNEQLENCELLLTRSMETILHLDNKYLEDNLDLIDSIDVYFKGKENERYRFNFKANRY